MWSPYLWESLHVPFDHLWVRALQFFYHLKTLVKLCEHVCYRTGEQRMLWCLLELLTQKHNMSSVFAKLLLKRLLDIICRGIFQINLPKICPYVENTVCPCVCLDIWILYSRTQIMIYPRSTANSMLWAQSTHTRDWWGPHNEITNTDAANK